LGRSAGTSQETAGGDRSRLRVKNCGGGEDGLKEKKRTGESGGIVEENWGKDLKIDILHEYSGKIDLARGESVAGNFAIKKSNQKRKAKKMQGHLIRKRRKKQKLNFKKTARSGVVRRRRKKITRKGKLLPE